MNYLGPLGFQKVFLEDYKVTTQTYIFNNAKVIIGVHGSGLSNFVFCKPNTKVIEIDPYDGHRGPFRWLAKEVGLNYLHLKTTKQNLSQSQKINDDVFVDINKLSTLLSKRLS